MRTLILATSFALTSLLSTALLAETTAPEVTAPATTASNQKFACNDVANLSVLYFDERLKGVPKPALETTIYLEDFKPDNPDQVNQIITSLFLIDMVYRVEPEKYQDDPQSFRLNYARYVHEQCLAGKLFN